MCTRIVWICFENIGADSVGLGWSLKFCISENLPGDAGVDAAGWCSHLEEQTLKNTKTTTKQNKQKTAPAFLGKLW